MEDSTCRSIPLQSQSGSYHQKGTLILLSETSWNLKAHRCHQSSGLSYPELLRPLEAIGWKIPWQQQRGKNPCDPLGVEDAWEMNIKVRHRGWETRENGSVGKSALCT